MCGGRSRSPEVPTISTTLSPDAATTPDTAQALLFDCDGTLVDSVAAWEQAWIRALAEYGVPITSDWYRARAGLSPRDLVHAAERDAGAPLDLDVVLARGIALYVDSAATVRPNQPVLEVARTHHGRVPLAVVSGGPRSGVDAALAAVGARHLFDHVITIDDVSRGKPAPDLYLRALEVLGRTARSCLAYEDSDEGLRAAAAAGIPVIDVRRGTVASAP
ncbi:haloacid dehalogenase superfamily, subfamily IA, variant 3 with third motif having DD or ED [Geodermatophilus amargosae]|uniref:Haloacid dehalogenase superfamily, subfamily IA, variant 3 with third motif having DD or ED n=1 Tax=Geodermatophilus amargosae TaxID=1296565 RepID=A0A1I7BHU2_9ACTN|nr:HAD family phosphatase [Geodermatophilus amargosae]SFT86759.1 haloacid dehalogenase superfamily, subfamily IA, variant 3 with third motif having DD or ED [Geodermatophilus amargosae]